MFVDSVSLILSAGNGGNGVVAWRREKFIPKGGPSGGNGGRGGSVYLRPTSQAFSLEALRNRKHLKAENGLAGGGSLKQGRDGIDLIIDVPAGTLVKNAKTKEILFDITNDSQTILLCKGGKGGRGNHSFRSPTHQAPNVCTQGTSGQSLHVELELKLIADVGLIGMPNAGKSTLLSEITPLRVKIGAYPFTTLYPNLSYVQFEDFSRILVADIPGLIEYAHENKGLGIDFLKHIERSSILVYVVDISGMEQRDPFEDFLILRKELEAYKPEILDKPFLVVLNKMDMEGADQQAKAFRKKYSFPEQIFEISAMENIGLKPLIEAMRQKVLTTKASRPQ